MIAIVAPAPACNHNGDMKDARRLLQKVLAEGPASGRALAREAGVSHSLLVKVASGERQLTDAVRDSVVRALRVWSATYADIADRLEAADLGRSAEED